MTSSKGDPEQREGGRSELSTVLTVRRQENPTDQPFDVLKPGGHGSPF